MNFLSEYQKILLNSTSEKCCCRSVICLGINDAGRCCLMKQQLSSLTALVASNLHISFTNTGHLAISAVMECKKGGKKSRAEMYFWFGRSVNCIADLHLDSCGSHQSSVVRSDLLCSWDLWIYYFFLLISLIYLCNLLGEVMNCKREEGLRWNGYGWTVMAAWGYRPTICCYFRQTTENDCSNTIPGVLQPGLN